MKKIIFAAFLSVLFVLSLSAQDLTGANWRVWNLNTSEPKFWDTQHTRAMKGEPAGFAFNQLSSGWYTAYMDTNFGNLSKKTTITFTASWTGSGFTNRSSTAGDAHFRVYFQSAQGNATSNDYWWTSLNCDLNAGNTCTVTVPLDDRTLWSNMCGHFANDSNSYAGPNCIGGTDTATSPYDGFTKALRNAKSGGLSFGGGSFYANGVAIADTTEVPTFQLQSYVIN